MSKLEKVYYLYPQIQSDTMVEQEHRTLFLPVLLVLLSFTVFIRVIKFYWSRRKMYRLASSIPGDTGYPIVGNALSYINLSNYEFLNKMTALGKKYSPIYKIWVVNKLLIVLSEPEHLECVMNNTNCLSKDDFYDITKAYMGLGIFTAPVSIWKKNRKIINPSFNQKILNRFQPIFNKGSKEFINSLVKYVGRKDVDIMKLTSVLTLSTLCETVMGLDINNNKHFVEYYGQRLDKALEIVMKKINNVMYHIDFLFERSKDGKDYKKVLGEMKEFTEKVVQEKKEAHQQRIQYPQTIEVTENESTKHISLLDHLVQLTFEGIKLTDQELQDEVNTFMAAGSDTTSATLSYCFLTLGILPEIQQKVYEEVIDVIGEDGDVTLEDLHQLQYTERFIKETMRIFPIATMYARTSPVDIRLGDHEIPANSTIVLFPLLTHRNPKHWKDPMKFDADRFLPEETAKRHPYSFVPFSGGPRGCIGIRYSYMILKTVIAQTIRKYKIYSGYKSLEEVELMVNFMLRPLHGYKVSVELRN